MSKPKKNKKKIRRHKAKKSVALPSGILQLLAALERHETDKVAIFCRTSTVTQEGRGSLERQWQRTYQTLRELPNARLKAIVVEQECGRMSQDRPHFKRIVKLARKHNAIVCAEDVTRFLRAEESDKTEPTPQEWTELSEMVGNVQLATILDPTLPLNKLHSEKTKLGMRMSGKKAGRPKKLTKFMLVQILCERRFANVYGYEPFCAPLNLLGVFPINFSYCS